MLLLTVDSSQKISANMDVPQITITIYKKTNQVIKYVNQIYLSQANVVTSGELQSRINESEVSNKDHY